MRPSQHCISFMKTEHQKRIVISVESCKGGTGKSIIALELAKNLTADGYAALVIDADFSGTSLTHVLGSNLYPFTEYHPVHKRNFPDDIPDDEELYADTFEDFHRYLREHRAPTFRTEKFKTSSGDCDNTVTEYHIATDKRVNVYGSNLHRKESKAPPPTKHPEGQIS